MSRDKIIKDYEKKIADVERLIRKAKKVVRDKAKSDKLSDSKK